MPEAPRISIHAYMDARLDEQDERIERRIEEIESKNKLQEQSIKLEARETRAWVLLLTSPSWAAFIQDWTSHDVATAFAVLAFVFGLIGIAFYRTRKPVIQNAR